MDECTSTLMCLEGLKRTGPHTGDTWSPRLRGGSGSSSGALCTCNAPIKVQRAPQTDVAALTQAQDGRKNGCWPLKKRLGDKSGQCRNDP